MRSDIISNSKFPFDENILVDSNTVYIPNCCDFLGINDQMAYGDFNSMKKYCDEYNNLSTILSKLHHLNPEQILKKYLNNSGLNIKRYSFDYELNPKRNSTKDKH